MSIGITAGVLVVALALAVRFCRKFYRKAPSKYAPTRPAEPSPVPLPESTQARPVTVRTIFRSACGTIRQAPPLQAPPQAAAPFGTGLVHILRIRRWKTRVATRRVAPELPSLCAAPAPHADTQKPASIIPVTACAYSHACDAKISKLDQAQAALLAERNRLLTERARLPRERPTSSWKVPDDQRVPVILTRPVTHPRESDSIVYSAAGNKFMEGEHGKGLICRVWAESSSFERPKLVTKVQPPPPERAAPTLSAGQQALKTAKLEKMKAMLENTGKPARPPRRAAAAPPPTIKLPWEREAPSRHPVRPAPSAKLAKRPSISQYLGAAPLPSTQPPKSSKEECCPLQVPSQPPADSNSQKPQSRVYSAAGNTFYHGEAGDLCRAWANQDVDRPQVTVCKQSLTPSAHCRSALATAEEPEVSAPCKRNAALPTQLPSRTAPVRSPSTEDGVERAMPAAVRSVHLAAARVPPMVIKTTAKYGSNTFGASANPTVASGAQRADPMRALRESVLVTGWSGGGGVRMAPPSLEQLDVAT